MSDERQLWLRMLQVCFVVQPEANFSLFHSNKTQFSSSWLLPKVRKTTINASLQLRVQLLHMLSAFSNSKKRGAMHANPQERQFVYLSLRDKLTFSIKHPQSDLKALCGDPC